MIFDYDKTIVLYGRSPFINTIRDYIPDICNKYHSIGCNSFVNTFPEVETVIFYDNTIPKFLKKHLVICPTKYKLLNDTIKKHIKKETYQTNWTNDFETRIIKNTLSIFNCTPTMALNWAYFKGFKTVILIGIDLLNNTNHFDNEKQMFAWKDKRIQETKEYFEFINQNYLQLFNLNPLANMDIPKITIEDLLK